MVAGFNEDLSREQIQQMEKSMEEQKRAAKEKKAAEKAEAATAKETASKDSSGEKPGLLRRMWARVTGGSEKYWADMEAHIGKQWEKQKAEIEGEVESIIQDTEKHTDDTIVDLEYKIHSLVKAGELDPNVGEKLTAKLEALRSKAKTVATETITNTEEEFDEFDSGRDRNPDAEDSDREDETPPAATVSEAVPTTPPETPQKEAPTAEAAVEKTQTVTEQATDLTTKQAKILESFKDNPHGRTEEEQNKFAWFELSTSADFPADTKQKVDALRQDWAKKDKAAGNPAELNDTGDDYKEGTNQWKLQTGEALRQVVEEAKKALAPEAQPATAEQSAAEVATGANPETPATAKDDSVDEYEAGTTDPDYDAARQESDREDEPAVAVESAETATEEEDEAGDLEAGYMNAYGPHGETDEDEEVRGAGVTETAPKEEAKTVETETKKLPERLTRKEGESVVQYLQKIDGSIRAGELTKSNMEDFRTHLSESFKTVQELKQVNQSVCENLVKSKQTELAKQFAHTEKNPLKRGDQFYAIASAMVEDGQATTADQLDDALFQIIDPAKRGEILNKLDTKNATSSNSTAQAANDNSPHQMAA